jgi:hypothetical protein
MSTTLANLLRPKSLDDFLGQEHLLGNGSVLRDAIDKDTIRSMILFGPSGTGKTTLAEIIAAKTNSNFIRMNATIAKTADVKEAINKAKISKDLDKKKTIVSIDECLPYDTLITCLINNKIVQVKIGKIVDEQIECRVLSYNLETDEIEWQNIEGWHVKEPKEMIELIVEENGKETTLRCSHDHRIYTKNRGYVEAANLTSEDEIVFKDISEHDFAENEHDMSNLREKL